MGAALPQFVQTIEGRMASQLDGWKLKSTGENHPKPGFFNTLINSPNTRSDPNLRSVDD